MNNHPPKKIVSYSYILTIFIFILTIEDIQYLWDKCQPQQNHENDAATSPLLIDFAQNLPDSLSKYIASTVPVTPQWVFSPFISVLKHIISTVASDNHRVIRISLLPLSYLSTIFSMIITTYLR